MALGGRNPSLVELATLIADVQRPDSLRVSLLGIDVGPQE